MIGIREIYYRKRRNLRTKQKAKGASATDFGAHAHCARVVSEEEIRICQLQI